MGGSDLLHDEQAQAEAGSVFVRTDVLASLQRVEERRDFGSRDLRPRVGYLQRDR